VRSDDDIWSDFNIWIARVTGLQTIRIWQGGPQPETPYLVTNLTGSRQVRDHHQDILGEDDPDTGEFIATPIIEMEWNFSVNCYGERPMNILRPIIAASKLTQVEEPNFPALVIHQCSQIRNLSEWHDHDWEPRAQMDVDLRGLTADGHLIDIIETSEGVTFVRI
jgi:hypothetical protein